MIEIIIGFISGIVSSMGMGGGTILILLLSMIMNLKQNVAQAANLIFYIPTAIISIIIGIKNKNIEWKEGLIVIISGIVGAIISANVSSYINVNILGKMFGVFLIIIAIYEIYSWYKMYIKIKTGETNNK